MREILFRGKRMYNGKWVEGSFLRDGEAHRLARQEGSPFSDCYIVPKTERDNVRTYLTQSILLNTIAYHITPATVGQYTGLKDKNGRRIFEGDIVEYNDGYDYFRGEVVFENGAFGVGSFEVIGLSRGCCDNFANLWQLFWDQEVTDDPELYYCTVIGNIHDNPELMEDNNAK